MTIYEKLMLIQNELSVPKGRENEYAGFFYRNAEDIFRAAKPVCMRHGAALTVCDNVLMVGDRHYIHAMATLHDTETKECISISGYAREAVERKKMDVAQVTGGASSYARKYALNGLFCLSDGETDALDPDAGAREPVKAAGNAGGTENGNADADENSNENVNGNVNGNAPEKVTKVTYFYVADTGSYVKKRAGQNYPEGDFREITKTEFDAGIAADFGKDDPRAEVPFDEAGMPEAPKRRSRRNRNTETEE